MPELGSDTEPTRVLLVVRNTPENQSLSDGLKRRMPELLVDQAEGVVSGLAHLFETPPDILLIDATIPGIDATVFCRELNALSIASRLRVIVVRPRSMAEHDSAIKESGVSTILDAPINIEEIYESILPNSNEAMRNKAS
jgi:DNA-binding response OmpR family regulator